ncbi:MAG: hypothetical protein CMJ78_02120 [Planctomycetaceae bacterium]|nr:hypothetical protein [Planctomycetaceae bacterium]
MKQQFLRLRTLHVVPFVCLAFSIIGCNKNTPSGSPAPKLKPIVAQDSSKSAADPIPVITVTEPPKSVNDDVVENTTTSSTQVARAQTPAQVDAVRTVYLPPDDRPKHNEQRLNAAGIFRFESTRLKLYTDIDAKIARALPPMVDALFDELQSYFGKLPPMRSGKTYQITGYIIGNLAAFEATGMLPRQGLSSYHGRQIGRRFWLHDQSSPYYRKHLMLHEATHCFMQATPGVSAPTWYMEGTAELFATHQATDGKLAFRLLPYNEQDFPGHGRIMLTRRENKKIGFEPLANIIRYEDNEFRKRNECYAWSWALSVFLDKHPAYHERFRKLGQHTTGRQFQRVFQQTFSPDIDQLKSEWAAFAADICAGFDIERAAINFERGRPITANAASVEIESDRGWQSTRWLLQAGKKYQITATGKITLAQEPKPWVSEAQGISFRYAGGRPIGQLLGTLLPVTDRKHTAFTQPTALGTNSTIQPKVTSTLYLRVNDYWNELADNKGSFRVSVKLVD